jgi:hypothetical protein
MNMARKSFGNSRIPPMRKTVQPTLSKIKEEK